MAGWRLTPYEELLRSITMLREVMEFMMIETSAKAIREPVKPIEPPLEGVTLTLSVEDAKRLYRLVGCIGGGGEYSNSFGRVYSALKNVFNCHTNELGIPGIVWDKNYNTPCIRN